MIKEILFRWLNMKRADCEELFFYFVVWRFGSYDGVMFRKEMICIVHQI